MERERKRKLICSLVDLVLGLGLISLVWCVVGHIIYVKGKFCRDFYQVLFTYFGRYPPPERKIENRIVKTY